MIWIGVAIFVGIGAFFCWRSRQLQKYWAGFSKGRSGDASAVVEGKRGVRNSKELQKELNILKEKIENLEAQNRFLREELAQHQSSEAHYRAIVENQQEFIIRWSLDTFRITYANPAFCQYFQVSPESVIGKDIGSCIYAEDRERVIARLKGISSSNPVITLEARVILPSQEIRFHKWMSYLVCDGLGNLIEIQSIGQDTTENKLVEEALQRIESRSQALLEGIPDTMFLLDRQGTFLDFRSRSPVVAEPGKVLYSNLREFPEFAAIADQVLQSISVAIESGMLQSFEYQRELPEETYYFEARITASGDQEVVMLVRDITDRRRAEEAYLALTREQEINQLQQHFFAMISHEFRTPLNVMRMSIGILESISPEWRSEKVSRNLQRIKTASDRILSMIDNMVTIYQVETEFFEPIWETVKVAPFFASLIAEVPTANDSKIVLIVDQPDHNIYSDLRLLRCIIVNLLTNAIKYSNGEITLETRHELEQIRIFVRDCGIGIPDEELKNIFTPFFRGSNVGKLHGSGLGLSIVKKCVEVFGGDIQVVSKEGVGTTFLVVLPTHPPSY